MNIQTPWVFFPSATHAQAAANKAAANAAAAAGYIPMNCPPGAQLLPQAGLHHQPSPFAAFNVAAAQPHHSQLLLAAAAAAYGQAAASHLLHQPQHQHPHQQLPNGYHLKVHKVMIYNNWSQHCFANNY
jgi:hypothetical protein